MDIQKHASDYSAENLRKSYINNILNRNTYIHNFISMLLNIEKGGVIAIDGAWGSGKTYFVHQVKWLLNCTSKNIDSEVESVLSRTVPKLDNIKGHKYKAFYYDAWKHDKSNNPFFTLLRTMILAFGGIDYFNHDKVIFVLSTNLKEFQHCIKQYYGEGFDGWKYLDRFIDIRLTLPIITVEAYCKYLWNNLSNDRIDDLAICCAKHFNLTLREIERYNYLIKISIQKAIEKRHKSNAFKDEYQYLYAFWIPVILAIKFHSSEEYHEFISGNNNSLIKLLMQVDKFKNSAIAFLLNDNDKSNGNYVIIQEKVEYYYELIFRGYYSKGITSELRESIKLDDFRIDGAVKQNLINIVNLFSTWSVYDVE